MKMLTMSILAWHNDQNLIESVTIDRLGKSLKATIIASFSYNSFKWLANWCFSEILLNRVESHLLLFTPHTKTYDLCPLYLTFFQHPPDFLVENTVLAVFIQKTINYDKN